MKNIRKCLIVSIGIIIGATTACKKDFLDRQPVTVVADADLWKDQKLILGLLANYYNRIPTDMGLTDQAGSQWRNMADYDDAMWSGQTNADLEARNNIINYSNSRWFLYDYGFIRDLNLAIENTDKYGAGTLSEAQRTQLKAEFRFIRAYQYFEMVKREGGVPLVTKQLLYDYSGNAGPLQEPRAKEADVYDFIASEMDAIQNEVGNSTDAGKFADVTRANKYTCLALKSRAMLYAASIAKYNALLTPTIVTGGGEVGIPASRANEYYQKALDASKAVINSGFYSLYNSNPNLGENFYEAIRNKTGNKEVMFVRDFLTAKAKKHYFSYDNIARGLREDNLGSSSVTPSLNLVESYDYLDGSNGALKTRTADNSDYIYYNNLTDIFANKDARLYGTIIYPGAPFKGATVTMQAGVMAWNAATNSYTTIEGSDLSTNYTDGKTLVAASGPHRSIAEVTNTGFYLRKFIDNGGGTSTRGIQSDVWWIWFRLSEMYLNAAEAAFELGQTADAVTYVNAIRARAGFTGANLYTTATITRDKIRNEFRTEFAFEDHRVWDLKRWRIADQVWNGNASNPNAVVYALYPYRIVRPGDTRDGKYVFVKMVAPRFKAPRFFQQFNYYSRFDQNVINNNPKVVQNPFN